MFNKVEIHGKGKSVLVTKNIYKKVSYLCAAALLSNGSVFALGGSGDSIISSVGPTNAFIGLETVAISAPSTPSASRDTASEPNLAAQPTGSAQDSSVPTVASSVNAHFADTDSIAAKAAASAKPAGAILPAQKQDQIFPDLEELVFVGENKILMDYIYTGITGFIKLSDDERSCVEAGHAKGAVYGEIPYDSLQVILDNELIGPNDVFYDFGSGAGKVVTQVYLNTPVKKAIGIEASFSRYSGCMRMMQKFKATDAYMDRKYNAKARRTITFINKNFLKVDVSDATVIYMCATCFEPGLMEKLVQKFAKINRIGLRVITLKKLPDHEKHGFRFDRGYQLPMSWSRNGKKSSVFVYTYVGSLLR